MIRGYINLRDIENTSNIYSSAVCNFLYMRCSENVSTARGEFYSKHCYKNLVVEEIHIYILQQLIILLLPEMCY